MQLFRSSAPVALSVLVLLSNLLCFTSAFPLNNSLNPRDVVCAKEQLSCGIYCCPPGTTCVPGGSNGGCPPAATLPPLPTLPALPTLPLPTLPALPTTTGFSTSLPAAAAPHKSPFSSTTLIIIVSVGGGVALILILIGTWACHRKRQQGRALLAAYESPDREPYEAISLKTKKSTASFISTAPPRTPTTDNTFNVPQHAATPPPTYRGDEKQQFPRFPPSTLQVSETTPIRAVFPVEVLASPRTSSLPPYSPQGSSAFTAYSPQRGAPLEVKTAFSPVQSGHSPMQPGFAFTTQPEPVKLAYTQPTPVQQTFSPVQPALSFTPQPNVPFSPMQTAFPPAQPVFSPVQSTFSLAPQSHTPVRPLFSPVQSEFSFATHGTTPVCSPPVSPHTARMAGEDMFLPVNIHTSPPPPQQQQQQQAYPTAY